MKEARTHGGCGSRQPTAKVGMGRWLGLEFLRDDEGRERRPLEFDPGDEGDATESIGGGRVFSIFLMVGGVGTMLFILTLVVQTVVEGEVLKGFLRRRRMKTRLAGLNRHLILCGFGRVGREVSRTFQSEGVPFIVVDKSTQVIAEVDEMGLPYIQGDASDDETLLSAGIKAARGLVATVGSNSDNVFITLSARALNPTLTIVARSTSPETEGKP